MLNGIKIEIIKLWKLPRNSSVIKNDNRLDNSLKLLSIDNFTWKSSFCIVAALVLYSTVFWWKLTNDNKKRQKFSRSSCEVHKKEKFSWNENLVL